jgi:hypothetical protein
MHKGIFIVFVVGAIQAKQIPIGLSTQRNNGIGRQTLYVIKREENGHRRLGDIKTKTN